MKEWMVVKSVLAAICFGLVASNNILNTIAASEIFEDAIPEGFTTGSELNEKEKLEDVDNDELVDAAIDANVQEATTKDDNAEAKGGFCTGSLCGKKSTSGIKTRPAQTRRRRWWLRRRASLRRRRGYIRYRCVRRRKDSRSWWVTSSW